MNNLYFRILLFVIWVFLFFKMQCVYPSVEKVNDLNDCMNETLLRQREKTANVKLKSGSQGLEYDTPYDKNHHKPKHCL